MNWHWSYIMGRVRKPLADRYTETYYGFPGWQSGIVVDGPGGVEDPARYVPMADRFFFLKQLTSPIYGDRKSVVWGQSVSVRVDLGGRRIIKKKKHVTTRRSTHRY